MRDEIGVDTINFGRDYPTRKVPGRTRSTTSTPCSPECPRTTSARCSGRTPSGSSASTGRSSPAVAEQVGFTIDAITGPSAIDAALLGHLQDRCGFAKPAEGASRIHEIEDLVRDDVVAIGAKVDA